LLQQQFCRRDALLIAKPTVLKQLKGKYSTIHIGKINEYCAHSDSDVGFIISTFSIFYQRVDGTVIIVRVNKRHTCTADVRVGVNLAHKIVVRLVELHVDLGVAQKLWLIYKQRHTIHISDHGLQKYAVNWPHFCERSQGMLFTLHFFHATKRVKVELDESYFLAS